MHPKRTVPGPGQESVWDYPRPPRLELSTQRIRIVFNGVTIADSHTTQRLLETSHPPVYYIPPSDLQMTALTLTTHHSWCEWKGQASYYTVHVGERRAENVAWFYPSPTPTFRAIQDYVAFYPSKMDACYVDDELVQAQAGDFYGGWITKAIVGPFKGDTGTRGW